MNIDVLDYYKIKYKINIKDIKRLSLRYNKDNVLEINLPKRLDFSVAYDFINKHIDWILKNEPTRPLPHDSYSQGDSYLLLGKTYKLEIIYQHHEEVILEDNSIVIYTKSDDRIMKLLESFRMKIAETVFNEVLYKSFKAMEKDLPKYPNLIIKPSKAKWGCCYFLKNEIMLNISLIHTPLRLIEYVVFHELTHFVHPDHSKEFHLYLERYLPDERKRKKELANYNIMYK